VKAYITCVRLLLEYAACVWLPYQLDDIAKIESVQSVQCRYLGVFFRLLVAAPLGVAFMMPNVDSFGRLTPFSAKRAIVNPNR